MKVSEVLIKVEELNANLSKLTQCELNRIAGYVEGLISAKQLREAERVS